MAQGPGGYYYKHSVDQTFSSSSKNTISFDQDISVYGDEDFDDILQPYTNDGAGNSKNSLQQEIKAQIQNRSYDPSKIVNRLKIIFNDEAPMITTKIPKSTPYDAFTQYKKSSYGSTTHKSLYHQVFQKIDLKYITFNPILQQVLNYYNDHKWFGKLFPQFEMQHNQFREEWICTLAYQRQFTNVTHFMYSRIKLYLVAYKDPHCQTVTHKVILLIHFLMIFKLIICPIMSLEEIYDAVYQPLIESIKKKDYEEIVNDYYPDEVLQHEICRKIWHNKFETKIHHDPHSVAHDPHCYVHVFLCLVIVMCTHFRMIFRV